MTRKQDAGLATFFLKCSNNFPAASTAAFKFKKLFAKNEYFSLHSKLFWGNQLLKQEILGILSLFLFYQMTRSHKHSLEFIFNKKIGLEAKTEKIRHQK